MRRKLTLAASLAAAIILTAGCSTPLPPGAEPGPHGTMAYDVLVEASPPGAQIVANGQDCGPTPVHIKIFGDPDGTFHDFGSYFYEVRALPIATNQYSQVHLFRTGHLLTPEDRVPSKIVFDMNQPSPAYPPGAAPGYGPPAYYYPYTYPYPYYGPYWGPSVRFYFGPGFHHW